MSDAPNTDLPLLGMTAGDSGLRLAYIFDSNPDPIRASPGGNPRTVDLHVVVSNPQPDAGSVVVKSIAISFPLGHDIDADLSGDPVLPPPVLISPGSWTVTLNGDRNGVAIRPTPPAEQLTFEGNPLVFAINGIKINTRPGTVTLDITERSADGSRQSAQVQLKKLVADFPVSAFFAEPSVIADLKGPTTLKWLVTEDGRNRSYSVYSKAPWRRGGLTAADGAAGVDTPAISQRTTFFLDVIQKQGGRETIDATLRTLVDVNKLELERGHHVTVSPTGRLAKIGWLAHNAIRCSVWVDGNVVDDNAPADTYLENDRYFLTLLEKGTHKVEVVAHGLNGVQTDRLQIGDPITVTDPVKIVPKGFFHSAAITRDGGFALLSPTAPVGQFVVLDLARRKQIFTLPGDQYDSVALLPLPGDTTLIAANNKTKTVEQRKVGSLGLTGPLVVRGAHLPRRGAFALFGQTFLHYWDYAKSQGRQWAIPEPNVPSFAVAASAAEDRLYVVLTKRIGAGIHDTRVGYVDLLDEPSSGADSFHLLNSRIGVFPRHLEITPDGKCAIVTASIPGQGVYVIDLEKDALIDEIPRAAPGFALLPGARTVWSGSEWHFSVYDLARREERTIQPNFPCGVLAVAGGTSRSGSQPIGLTASEQGGSVCLI